VIPLRTLLLALLWALAAWIVLALVASCAVAIAH
jgi:hypothetical protein